MCLANNGRFSPLTREVRAKLHTDRPQATGLIADKLQKLIVQFIKTNLCD